MQEFSSISVSSYEAGSLADRLTEQSAAGWDVVSIVPTGSTITAYLSREGAADEHTPAPEITVAAAAANEPEVAPEPAVAASETVAAGDVGWGASSNDHADAATEHGIGAGADLAASTVDVAATPGAAATGTASATETATAAATGTAAATETATAAASGAAPAGWYADPSSRYELRYWDGGQWTEHVSRGGQQYTDPPVA